MNSMALMELVIREWLLNPTLILGLLIRTGPSHIMSECSHNGQITNYWIMRREMERKGHRFMSNCDSELLAVYTAHNLANGLTLEQSLRNSIEEIDGFYYLVATKDHLGMAKDTMAAKPLRAL